MLDWFAALKPGFAPVHEPVEVLLVADCNYYSRAVDALLAAVLLHLAPGGTLVLASREGRASLDEFLDRLHAHGEFTLARRVTFDTDDDGMPVADAEAAGGEAKASGGEAEAAGGEAKAAGREVEAAGGEASSEPAVHRMWTFTRAAAVDGAAASVSATMAAGVAIEAEEHSEKGADEFAEECVVSRQRSLDQEVPLPLPPARFTSDDVKCAVNKVMMPRLLAHQGTISSARARMRRGELKPGEVKKLCQTSARQFDMRYAQTIDAAKELANAEGE
eukprot:4811812-Prymnesium_polylepis.1